MTRIVLAITVAVLAAAPARAQSASPLPGRLEAAFGTTWIGRTNFGSMDANETTGTGGDFRLFSSATELASGAGLDAHLSFRVATSFEAEAFGSYTKPEREVSITSDAETSNAPLTVTDTVREFTIGGAGLWYPPAPRLGNRARLFVRGGLAYLRDLENDGTLIVTGRAYEVGGGVKLMFTARDSGWWKGIGARLDARAVVRQKGVAPDDGSHVSPAVGAAVFVRF